MTKQLGFCRGQCGSLELLSMKLGLPFEKGTTAASPTYKTNVYHWVAYTTKKELVPGSFPSILSISTSAKKCTNSDPPWPVTIKAEVLLVCRVLGASTPSLRPNPCQKTSGKPAGQQDSRVIAIALICLSKGFKEQV